MKLLAYFILACAVTACTATPKSVSISIQNPSAYNRSQEIVEISLDSLKSRISLTDDHTYVVKNQSGDIVPSQVTYDNKLIFQSGLTANGQGVFTIEGGKNPEFTPKTYGRYIKERKDDFAWENDKVAFRIYGPALVPIDGPSNGIDIWYKRTGDMVIDKWYKNDLAGVASYHNDNGEGLDDYSVSRSLGAGAMAPWVNDKLWLNQNYANQEMLENGPLRTTFKLTYNDIEVAGKKFAETRLFSIDAGSQLTKVVQSYNTSEPITVAAGIVLRDIKDQVITSAEKGYIIYPEPGTPKASGVFVSIVLPSGIKSITTDTYEAKNPAGRSLTYRHTLALTDYQPGKPLTYYTGYGWTQFGFPTTDTYKAYIENFVAALKKPFTIYYL